MRIFSYKCVTNIQLQSQFQNDQLGSWVNCTFVRRMDRTYVVYYEGFYLNFVLMTTIIKDKISFHFLFLHIFFRYHTTSVTYLTLPKCHVLIDVGDHRTPPLSILRQPHQSGHRHLSWDVLNQTRSKLQVLPASRSPSFYSTKERLFF